MLNKQATQLLNYVQSNTDQIERAVQLAFLAWRKQLLIEQFAKLMQKAGIVVDNGTKKTLLSCNSVLDLTGSIKELAFDLILTAKKHFKAAGSYLEFLYVIGQPLEDWLRKHKESVFGEIKARALVSKQQREKGFKSKL